MGKFEKVIDRLCDLPKTWTGTTLLIAVSAGLFVAAQVSINAVNGWWGDELFSLWASDVSVPFNLAFNVRIAPDSTPPLYLSLLYWVRWFVAGDRTAVLALNITAIVIAVGAVLIASWRIGLGRLAACGVAAFVLSGPVLSFSSEGRSYCLASAVVFVASWYVALAIMNPYQRPVSARFIVLGAVAALAHVYAALLCGGLAAGLLAFALFSHRRDLVWPGLALGLSTSIVFIIWLSVTWNSALVAAGWIEFSPKVILDAAKWVEKVAVGWHLTTLLLVFPLVFGLFDRATRPLFVTFGIASVVFVILPVIVSFKHPMIVGRYWLVGAPVLITLMIFATRAWCLAAGGLPKRRRIQLAAASSALFFLSVSDLHAFITTASGLSDKPIWRGAKMVRHLLNRCPTGSVHVATDVRSKSSFIWAFSKMTGASPSLFVDAKLQSTPNVSPASTHCPVLGWAEDIWWPELKGHMTDADLLKFLKIEASPDEVEVRRHNSGFVILKPDLLNPASRASH